MRVENSNQKVTVRRFGPESMFLFDTTHTKHKGKEALGLTPDKIPSNYNVNLLSNYLYTEIVFINFNNNQKQDQRKTLYFECIIFVKPTYT